MADSDERKSVETEHDSDDDGVSALLWTARRLEASDDDDDSDEVKQLIGEEQLQEVSQEDGEVQEAVHVNKGKEKEDVPVTDPVFVPRHGSFYMHDDRSRTRRHGTRWGTMIGMKSWDYTDQQKWKHDKFEDTTVQDRSTPKSYHRQQRKSRNKGHGYADTNQFGSHDNFGNQTKLLKIVRGRGPVKYKPIVKSNNINPSSKHQMYVKKWSTFFTRSQLDFIPNFIGVVLFWKIPTFRPAKLKESTSSSSSSGRGQKMQSVMQLGGLPYVAVDDQAPSMARVGQGPHSQLGPRNRGVTSIIPAAARPCHAKKPLADGSALEPVENEFGQRRLKPQRYSNTRLAFRRSLQFL